MPWLEHVLFMLGPRPVEAEPRTLGAHHCKQPRSTLPCKVFASNTQMLAAAGPALPPHLNTWVELAWAQPARQKCVLLQGLSHYLEHMLFMGSAKFPDENSYDAFLSAHAGSSNAYTELVRCL